MSFHWRRIMDPYDRRRVVWWRGNIEPAQPGDTRYLSVSPLDGGFTWAVRHRAGTDHVAERGWANVRVTAQRQAERAAIRIFDLRAQ